jgi:hypothetical protein
MALYLTEKLTKPLSYSMTPGVMSPSFISVTEMTYPFFPRHVPSTSSINRDLIPRRASASPVVRPHPAGDAGENERAAPEARGTKRRAARAAAANDVARTTRDRREIDAARLLHAPDDVLELRSKVARLEQQLVLERAEEEHGAEAARRTAGRDRRR